MTGTHGPRRLAGTFTVQLSVSQAGTPTSLLEIYLFTVNSSGTLIKAGGVAAGAGDTVSLSTHLAAGESIYVEVKGRNSAPEYRDQGVYSLIAALS